MRHFLISRCIHTPNLKFLPQIILEICSGHDYSKDLVRGQGQSDPKMVRETPSSQDASTHKIWNSYLKEYRRYAPGTKRDGGTDIVMTIKTKSQVRVKVTVTRKFYGTLCHPKMYPHTKFMIPTSKNIGDMHRT